MPINHCSTRQMVRASALVPLAAHTETVAVLLQHLVAVIDASVGVASSIPRSRVQAHQTVAVKAASAHPTEYPTLAVALTR